MSEDKSLGAEHWFAKGTEAMNLRQWDYAIESLSNAIQLSPETLKYRQLKYRCCRKKHKAVQTGAGTTVKLVDVRRKLLQAKLKSDWAAVDKYAEEGVILAPWDAQVFSYIASSAMELERHDVATYTWSMAVKLDRTNDAYNRAFGRYMATRKEYDVAEKCFKRIQEQNPEDRYAGEMLRYIDVERLLNRGGYVGAGSTRDVEVPDERQLPEESGQQSMELDVGGIFDLAQKEANDPAVISESRQKANHIRLAKLCAEQRRWEMCLEAYQKALKITPDDVDIRERMEDAELSMMRENFENVQRAARKEIGSQRLQEEAVELERKLVERRIKVLSARAERYRADMTLRFDLADDYSKLGEYRLAIPLYQQACQNLNLREQALLKLGQCWICDGKHDMASRQFAIALKSLSPVESPEGWKTAHYWLGRLDENEGRVEAAESHYAEVLLLDYDFRDTVVRLDTLKSGVQAAVPQDA